MSMLTGCRPKKLLHFPRGRNAVIALLRCICRIPRSDHGATRRLRFCHFRDESGLAQSGFAVIFSRVVEPCCECLCRDCRLTPKVCGNLAQGSFVSELLIYRVQSG